ncbi:L domain-like protein [Rhizoclosmatium globosum]|uniref:L domain-like protein n=1 Tax=Rhizoclosmatium globosum TaxID=329046 RepID=A0A1Y2CLR0_9FUNG|nr:L domain-like protein [Rhizoclosmatium globosum]|eukprot:ORY47804.1 L domain-like protein [Rhizoclosmatium globosum]
MTHIHDSNNPQDTIMRQVTIVTLPKEVAESIMSWIHPKEVWSLRLLSTSFNELLSSRTFIRLNISRFVPPVNPSITAFRKPNKWDVLFSDAPAAYMEEYVHKYIAPFWSWSNSLVKKIPPRMFPTAWFQFCSNLTVFRGHECFKGEIPQEIGTLTSLQELDLSENEFIGEIPRSIGNLVNLTHLYLFENEGLCEIPPEIGTLISLRELELECNRLIGEIPPSIGNLINLTTLHLFENDGICGPVPPEIGLLKSLVSLSISGEELRGPIPVELCNLQNLKMLQLKFGVDFKTPTFLYPNWKIEKA